MKSKALRLSILLAGMLLLAAQMGVAAETKGHGPDGPVPKHEQTAPGPMGMPGMGGNMPGMVPPEKKDAYDAIVAKYKDQNLKLHQDVFAKQTEISGALAASSIDEGKVKTLTKELNGLQTQIQDLDTEKKIEMRKQGIPFGPYMLPHHGMGGMGGMGKGAMMSGKGMGGSPMMQGMQHETPPPPPPPPPANPMK